MPLSTITVADVMHADPPSIGLDEPVREALDRVTRSEFNCLVVVDEQQRPAGIVTEGDILRRVLAEEAPGGPYLRAILASDEAVLRHVRDAERAHGHRVRDLMTSPVATVTPGDSLQHVAEVLGTAPFRQLPVVRDGVLVGLVRSHDVMAPILRQHEEAERRLAGPGK